MDNDKKDNCKSEEQKDSSQKSGMSLLLSLRSKSILSMLQCTEFTFLENVLRIMCISVCLTRIYLQSIICRLNMSMIFTSATITTKTFWAFSTCSENLSSQYDIKLRFKADEN